MASSTGAPPRLSPMRFVVGFGIVSLLADFVYEGARSVLGPYLATLGASAALVGVITGAGEAVALVLRLGTGALTDRTRRPWPITIAGYACTLVCVPLLAVTNTVGAAAGFIVGERFGKAVRSPAKATMLSHAAAGIGRGRAFALHEAMDQTGALLGPLVLALTVWVSGGYHLGFAVLAIPGAAALVALAWLRRAVPRPAAFDPVAEAAEAAPPAPGERLPRRFWHYAGFTALTMGGFATFAVLSYHLQVRHVVSEATVPLIYAVAAAVDALAALASGRIYDRVGLRVLVVLPVLAAIVPFLFFTTAPLLVWIGAIVWGAAMGIHESTTKAAVADLVGPARRATAYGAFTAVYGLTWLGGSAAIGALYESSIGAAQVFVVVVQAVALIGFLPLARRLS